MMSAVRRAWVTFWVAAVVGVCSGATAISKALTESWWYAAFAAVDFASVALLVWSIIQLRRAHEAYEAEAAHRATVVREYVEEIQRSDRSRL